MKRAHIHHKDGDPTNNPADGSNWEVLCVKCHRKIPTKPSEGGIRISASFAPWKRAEIIISRGCRCERCGGELTLERLVSKPRPRCAICDRIVERKKDRRQWNDSIICIECFVQEEIMAKGQKAVPIDEYTYGLLQQAIDTGKAHNLADAILHGISLYLGITYKSKEERKAEETVARLQQLGKAAGKEE